VAVSPHVISSVRHPRLVIEGCLKRANVLSYDISITYVIFTVDFHGGAQEKTVTRLAVQTLMSKGDILWRNFVQSATLQVIASPKATGNVICVAGQGLTLAWRCYPGMRATAKDVAVQEYVPLVMGRAKSVELFI